MTTPVMISTPSAARKAVDLGREIVGQVLVAAGIGQRVALLDSEAGKPMPFFRSPQALPSPSLGNSAPTD